jgi:hypothetical protein
MQPLGESHKTVQRNCSNKFKDTVQINGSSKLPRLHCTLLHFALRHFTPCMDMHGPKIKLIYVYIYIYLFIWGYLLTPKSTSPDHPPTSHPNSGARLGAPGTMECQDTLWPRCPEPPELQQPWRPKVRLRTAPALEFREFQATLAPNVPRNALNSIVPGAPSRASELPPPTLISYWLRSQPALKS